MFLLLRADSEIGVPMTGSPGRFRLVGRQRRWKAALGPSNFFVAHADKQTAFHAALEMFHLLPVVPPSQSACVGKTHRHLTAPFHGAQEMFEKKNRIVALEAQHLLTRQRIEAQPVVRAGEGASRKYRGERDDHL